MSFDKMTETLLRLNPTTDYYIARLFSYFLPNGRFSKEQIRKLQVSAQSEYGNSETATLLREFRLGKLA